MITSSALKTGFFAFVFSTACSAAGVAQEIRAGDLVIEQPWTRATLAGSKVAGGFMTIKNTGRTADRLLSGSSEGSNVFEVHEMAVIDGKMTMRELKPGLDIKPGETVVLKPGSFHVMFIDLKQPFTIGGKVKGQLVFEKAGTVDVVFEVRPRGENQDRMEKEHGAEKTMKGKH
jgi:hypothetical protein